MRNLQQRSRLVPPALSALSMKTDVPT